MAVSDKSIDPRILASARAVFLQSGFEKASLKEICGGAGITTGALYKRYQGKEDLFCAVVADTVADLEAVIAQRGERDLKALPDEELIHAWDMDKADMLWWFRFLHERREGFVLLLRCAGGTRYANFQHDWVERMTGYTYAFLQEAMRRGLTRERVSQKELHILLSAFWATIYEPFIHDLSWAEIETHAERVCRLFDWNTALGFGR